MTDFIIIDDDPINNLICTRIIEISKAEANVKSYTNPEIALVEMRENYCKDNANEVVVFLDINMHELSGWEVLDQFNSFPEHVKQLFRIFILSSSVDSLDQQKARNNPYVMRYIAKPLSMAIMHQLLSEI